MERADPAAVQSAIVIASVIIGLVAHGLSGSVLDRPVFDHLYAPTKGRWVEAKEPQLLVFPPGYELAMWRTEARRKLAAEDPKYRNPAVGIREPVQGRLKERAAEKYKVTMQELAWSKAARNSILPAAFLALYALVQKAYVIALVLFLIVVFLFVPFLELRVRYITNLYRRYCELPSDKAEGEEFGPSTTAVATKRNREADQPHPDGDYTDSGR